MKLLIFGSTGQVASALKKLKPDARYLSRSEADLEDLRAVTAALNNYHPEMIINAAAYTNVAQAEKEEEKATKINAEAPEAMALWAKNNNALFINYSTDYVFDGRGAEEPFKETDQTHALNAYGRSKLEGEQRVLAQKAKSFIFRTSWVYDENGKNFVNTMLRLGKERPEIKVVCDQWGAPTYAYDIAEKTLEVISKTTKSRVFESGIYHMCNSGATNWYDFAVKIFELSNNKNIKVLPINSADYPDPVVRPKNSRLSCKKLYQTFGIRLRHWEEALKHCLNLSH